mgnify:CR=1 FL=1
MGGGGETKSQQTYQASPAEEKMWGLQFKQASETNPYLMAMQKAGLGLGTSMLKGGELPGWLKGLEKGISPEMTNEFSQQALRDISPQMQASGIMDSGVAASVMARTSGDIRRASAEFNIGNRLNLLNLALSGQAQIQQPVISQQQSYLAGLKGTGATWETQKKPGQGVNLGILGTWGGAYCWIAAEIFGGWNKPKTCLVRYYIGNIAPDWFRNFYIKYGERIAKFIHNKPILKLVLRPLFEYFAFRVNSLSTISY